MLQNFLDQFRARKSATSNGHGGDLERAITRLREMLEVDQPRAMTTAYLVELRAAVEAVEWAIKDEQWAREGYSTRRLQRVSRRIALLLTPSVAEGLSLRDLLAKVPRRPIPG